MRFFFIRDYRQKYRCFSSAPVSQIQIKFSRWRELWEQAKKKLMLLPPRILQQEQAFGRVLKIKDKTITIFHSGQFSKRKIRIKFYFFLQKQRSKHILFLVGEVLLLPISGLAALLPGPNIFFGVLALLMITHWQALKGLNRMLKKDYEFVPCPIFKDWELALETRDEKKFAYFLERIEKEYNLQSIQKVLWK